MGSKNVSRRHSKTEAVDWLESRLKKLNIASMSEFSVLVGIDRGTISRYFRLERRPSIDVIGPICDVLQVSPETLLIVLGAIDKKY